MKAILLATLSSLLLVLSFPDLDLHIMAWIGLVPLLLSIMDKKPLSASALSTLTGTLFFMGIFYWVNVVSGVTWVDYMICMVVLGIYFGIFGFTFTYVASKNIMPSYIAAPAVWVSIEYIRCHIGFLSMPWAFMAHSQYQNIPFIQISSFTGAYGVSFLIVMVNTALAEFVRGRFRDPKPMAIPLFILVLSFIYGNYTLSENTGEKNINITVIQGNIDISKNPDKEFQERILEKQVLLTEEAVKGSDTSLVIWPEGAVRGLLGNDSRLSRKIASLSAGTNTHLLVGSSRRPKMGQKAVKVETVGELRIGEKITIKRKYYNSAFLYSPEGELVKQYNKIRLLPFAEYLPVENFPFWPARYRKTDSFIPGNEHTTLDLGDTHFGVLICWENIFSGLFRKMVRNGAEFMVNITNEAWFGETSAPYQFLSMSVFRAVENRVPVVRSANTGVSCFIDPEGRITGRVQNGHKDIFTEGYLTKNIKTSGNKTFYTIYGDVFAYSCIVVTVVLLASSFYTNKKQLYRADKHA